MCMKTSDKILLFSSLSVVGLFLVLEVLHHVKYREGAILDFAAIEKRDFVSRQDTGVHWLVLDGPMRVLFYPSDHLKIDVDRLSESKFQYLRHGDTLLLTLNAQGTRSAHDNWFSFRGFPAVRVFFPPLEGIRLRNAFAAFNNEDGRKGISATLELDSTQCFIGNYSEERDSAFPTEPWDIIRVSGVNCNLVINKQAYVKTLDVRLDAKSEFSDRFSRIDTGYIQADSTTMLHLHGANLKKLRLDDVVHSAP